MIISLKYMIRMHRRNNSHNDTFTDMEMISRFLVLEFWIFRIRCRFNLEVYIFLKCFAISKKMCAMAISQTMDSSIGPEVILTVNSCTKKDQSRKQVF